MGFNVVRATRRMENLCIEAAKKPVEQIGFVNF